jgi:hypothetical protein
LNVFSSHNSKANRRFYVFGGNGHLSYFFSILLGVCVLIQSSELLLHPQRPNTALGASLGQFIRLISGQIFMGGIWGQNSFARRASIFAATLVFAAGASVLLYGLLKLRLQMKLLLIFAILVTAAALNTPLIAGQKARWFLLAADPGGRYWFFPMLAFLWSILWLASESSRRIAKIFCLACFVLMTRGVRHDWRHQP